MPQFKQQKQQNIDRVKTFNDQIKDIFTSVLVCNRSLYLIERVTLMPGILE